MHCPNCGKELKDNQKFCGGCGSNVSHLWQQAAPAPVVAAPVAPAPAVEPVAPVAPVAPVEPAPVAQPVAATPLAEPVPVEPAPSVLPEPVPEPVHSVLPEPVPEPAPPAPVLIPVETNQPPMPEPVPVESTPVETPAPVSPVSPIAPMMAAAGIVSAPAAPVEPAPVAEAPVEPVVPVEAAPVEAAPVEAAPVVLPPVEPVESVSAMAPVEPAPMPAPIAPAPMPAPIEPAPMPAPVEPSSAPVPVGAAPMPAPAPAAAPGPEMAPAPVQTAFGETVPAAPVAPVAQAAGGTNPPKKEKNLLGLIIGIAAAVLVLIVGAIVGIVFLVSNATKETERTKRTTEDDDPTTTTTEVVRELATRTIMVYAIGTDLESNGACLSADVKEMLAANPGKDVNIVLQTGGCSNFQNTYMQDGVTQRFSIINGNIKELDNLGDVSMVETQTLTDFIKFSKENYPAEHYILVMWDHGGGVPLGFGYDEINEGTLTDIEMAEAIGNADIEFESIIFNACLMGSLEVAKALDPYTEYIVAAESPTWGSAYYDIGINYTNFLNFIGKDFDGDAEDYGEFIVRDYMDNIESTQDSLGFYGIDTCMSCIDTDNIDEVLAAYEKFIAALDSRVFDQNGYAEYVQLRDDCGSFESTDSVDLTTLASKYINCGDKNIESAASTLINEVGNCVFTERNNAYTYAHGMTTYAPYLYPQYYDEARLTFTTLGYSDTTIKFYDKFVSMELYILGAVSYAGSWYVEPANAKNISSGNVYDISDLVVDMGNYEAIQLNDSDWDIIREVKVTLAYVFPDDDTTIYYMGTDNQYSVDGNGYIVLQNPTNWVYVKGFGFVTCECLKYEVGDDGKWYKYLGAEAIVNGQQAYVVIAFSTDDPEGQIIGYYYADIINDTYDNNQGYQFNENDTIIFIEEYYDIETDKMEYMELGDAVSFETAKANYKYSKVDYSDVEGYIGFDIYDVYNNDYRLTLRPGTPAYEIDAERGDYETGTIDATFMVGYVIIYDSDCVLADAPCDWMSSNDRLESDSVYYSDTDGLSLTFDVDSSVTDELTFKYYYSADTMFSDKETTKVIYSGTITPDSDDDGAHYHFDLPASAGIQTGYYMIAIEDESGNRIIISVCQVID